MSALSGSAGCLYVLTLPPSPSYAYPGILSTMPGLDFFIDFFDLDPVRQKRCIYFTLAGARCRWECYENPQAQILYRRILASNSENLSSEDIMDYILANCCTRDSNRNPSKVVNHQEYMEDGGYLMPLVNRWREQILTRLERTDARTQAGKPLLSPGLSRNIFDSSPVSIAYNASVVSTPQSNWAAQTPLTNPSYYDTSSKKSFADHLASPSSCASPTPAPRGTSRASISNFFGTQAIGDDLIQTPNSLDTVPRTIPTAGVEYRSSPPPEPEFRPHRAKPSPNDTVSWMIRREPQERDNETGFVYIFDRNGSPGHVKIGWTRVSVQQRLQEWSTHGYTPRLLYQTERICNAQRAETLTHYELISEWRRELQCRNPSCTVKHQEWFAVSLERAKRVVDDWVQFFQKARPFDNEGYLKRYWRDKVEEIDATGKPVTSANMLACYEASLQGAKLESKDSKHNDEQNNVKKEDISSEPSIEVKVADESAQMMRNSLDDFMKQSLLAHHEFIKALRSTQDEHMKEVRSSREEHIRDLQSAREAHMKDVRATQDQFLARLKTLEADREKPPTPKHEINRTKIIPPRRRVVVKIPQASDIATAPMDEPLMQDHFVKPTQSLSAQSILEHDRSVDTTATSSTQLGEFRSQYQLESTELSHFPGKDFTNSVQDTPEVSLANPFLFKPRTIIQPESLRKNSVSVQSDSGSIPKSPAQTPLFGGTKGLLNKTSLITPSSSTTAQTQHGHLFENATKAPEILFGATARCEDSSPSVPKRMTTESSATSDQLTKNSLSLFEPIPTPNFDTTAFHGLQPSKQPAPNDQFFTSKPPCTTGSFSSARTAASVLFDRNTPLFASNNLNKGNLFDSTKTFSGAFNFEFQKKTPSVHNSQSTYDAVTSIPKTESLLARLSQADTFSSQTGTSALPSNAFPDQGSASNSKTSVAKLLGSQTTDICPTSSASQMHTAHDTQTKEESPLLNGYSNLDAQANDTGSESAVVKHESPSFVVAQENTTNDAPLDQSSGAKQKMRAHEIDGIISKDKNAKADKNDARNLRQDNLQQSGPDIPRLHNQTSNEDGLRGLLNDAEQHAYEPHSIEKGGKGGRNSHSGKTDAVKEDYEGCSSGSDDSEGDTSDHPYTYDSEYDVSSSKINSEVRRKAEDDPFCHLLPEKEDSVHNDSEEQTDLHSTCSASEENRAGNGEDCDDIEEGPGRCSVTLGDKIGKCSGITELEHLPVHSVITQSEKGSVEEIVQAKAVHTMSDSPTGSLSEREVKTGSVCISVVTTELFT